MCLNNMMRHKLKDLPFNNIFISTESYSKCDIQWDKLTTVEWAQFFDSSILENNYSIWSKVSEYKDAGNNYVFSELSNYALTCLTLPSSNAAVERAFSVMAAVKPKCRNGMQIKMLNAILRFRLDLYSKNVCCKNVCSTEQMFKKFNSKEVYACDVNDANILEIFELLQ
ncbi:unnamed protein product [Psylliodes chrysocephalus]|uniref:HAT C-terminal dimerisation domain-containing protein n=1 Tax=Psylliodes chrysocephalus TaxID=3402493 RepID=A0A9P0CIM5_9CUCU|nr:unnamed protein product [Psylliodes chrysocephala]